MEGSTGLRGWLPGFPGPGGELRRRLRHLQCERRRQPARRAYVRWVGVSTRGPRLPEGERDAGTDGHGIRVAGSRANDRVGDLSPDLDQPPGRLLDPGGV